MPIEKPTIDLTLLRQIMSFAKEAAIVINANLELSGAVGKYANAQEFVLNNVSLLRSAYDQGLKLKEVEAIASSFSLFFHPSYFDETVAHKNFIEFKMGKCLFLMGFKKTVLGMQLDCFPNIDFSGVNLNWTELNGNFRFSKFPASVSKIQGIYFSKKPNYPVYIGTERRKAEDLRSLSESQAMKQTRLAVEDKPIEKDQDLLDYILVRESGVRSCFFSPKRKRELDLNEVSRKRVRFNSHEGGGVSHFGDYVLYSSGNVEESPKSLRTQTPRQRRLIRVGKYGVNDIRYYLFGPSPDKSEVTRGRRRELKNYSRDDVIKKLPLRMEAAKKCKKKSISDDTLVSGPRRVDQNRIMGVDANGYALTMGLTVDEQKVWEWLHLIAYCFGLPDDDVYEEKENLEIINDDGKMEQGQKQEWRRQKDNLVLAVFECNRHMLILEEELRYLVKEKKLGDVCVEVIATLEADKIIPDGYTQIAKSIVYKIRANGNEFTAYLDPQLHNFPQDCGLKLVKGLLDFAILSKEDEKILSEEDGNDLTPVTL